MYQTAEHDFTPKCRTVLFRARIHWESYLTPCQRIKPMITVYDSKSGEGAKAYFFSGLIHGDYHTEGQERVGDWWGKGAELLGLSGKVTSRQFCRLADNQHPFNAERLTLRNDLDRRAGYDLTFSPCKSFSVASIMLGDVRLSRALDESAKEVLREAEELVQARIRKNGSVGSRYTNNLIAALFQHSTARPEPGHMPDPQEHIHAFIMNATFDIEEDVWKAVEPVDIHRLRPYLEAFFHNDLARRVMDLGYEIEAKGKSWEIKGIPSEVIQQFSKRDARIQAEKKAKGIEDPAEAAGLARTTRGGKAPRHSLPELRQDWWSQLSPKVATKLRGFGPSPQARARLSPEAARKEALAIVTSVAASTFEQYSTVREQRFVGECLEQSRGRVTANDIRSAMADASLEVRHYKGALRVTHPEVYREEKAIIEMAVRGKGLFKPINKRPTTPNGLTKDQGRALRYICSSRDRFILIEGRAGTGKTKLTTHATGVMQSHLRTLLSPFIGDKFVVVAPQAAAARGVLREDGFKDANTVSRFLSDETMQSKAAGGWVVVDEAGHLGTREARKLMEAIEHIGARAVLIGDRKQLRSVSRGRAFDVLIDDAQCRTPVVEEIVRQKGSLKDIVNTLVAGHPEKAMRALESEGHVHRWDSPDRCKIEAGEEYYRRKKDNEKVVLITPTHKVADEITGDIRNQMKRDGKITRESKVRTWVDKHLTEEQCRHVENYKVGDMIRFEKPVRGFKRGVPYEVVSVAPFKFGPYKDQVIVRAKGEVAEALPFQHADRWTVYQPKEREFGVGDEVLITRTMMTHTVWGRLRAGVIDQFDLPEKEAMQKNVELTNGSRHRIIGRTLDGHYVLEGKKILDKDCGHFTHAYCMTPHASQSITSHSAILVGTSDQFMAMNARGVYVAASRAKNIFKVYTDDLDGLIAASKKDQEHVGAHELLEHGTSMAQALDSQQQDHEEFEHYRAWQRANEHETEQEHEHDR